MIQEGKIVVPKTARYYSIRPSEVKSVLYVIHGYRQLASNFIKKFQRLEEAGIMVVAPEGLHRFYVEGYSGKVGASWMTKEARTDDIVDYVEYLNRLHDSLDFPDVPVNVLGFSQGGPTVCRWLASNQFAANKLILHSTVFPNDFEFDRNRDWLNSISVSSIFGDDDQFASEETIEKKVEWMRENGVDPSLHRFKGGHEIHLESILKIVVEEA